MNITTVEAGLNSRLMPEPVIFKNSVSIALIVLLRLITPPLLVFSSLLGTAAFYHIPFDPSYVLLSVLATALAIVLLQVSVGITETLMLNNITLITRTIFRWVCLLGLLLAIGYALKFSEHFSRRALLTWAVITPVPLIMASMLLRQFMRWLLINPSHARRVVIAGCNEASITLASRLSQNSALCMRVAGFFDDRSATRLNAPSSVQMLGTLPELAPYVAQNQVDVIFIALPIKHLRRVVDLIDALQDTTASIYYVPDVFVFDLIQARTSEIMGIPVVSICETPYSGVRGIAKRVNDVLLTLPITLAALPLMLVIGLLVKFSTPGPMIFKQRRYGLDGREITVYKFRTMSVSEDGQKVAQATRDDDRITSIGKILRRYSLDELPQLFNVLQGRMSLVGPRPHAVAHNEQYRKLIKGYMIRHKVRPGITGLAQVNGCRGETAQLEDMQARVNYDLDYLRHWSPLLDIKILGMTALRLLRDKRAY